MDREQLYLMASAKAQCVAAVNLLKDATDSVEIVTGEGELTNLMRGSPQGMCRGAQRGVFRTRERAGRMKLALYFGSLDGDGHYLHGIPPSISRWQRTIYPEKHIPGFPWTGGQLDGRLLQNGNILDDPDGRVWWTCGGIAVLWHAFYWWDRSKDERGASNSGFYVRGFTYEGREAAFAFACEKWPRVVERQRHPLVLQPWPRSA